MQHSCSTCPACCAARQRLNTLRKQEVQGLTAATLAIKLLKYQTPRQRRSSTNCMPTCPAEDRYLGAPCKSPSAASSNVTSTSGGISLQNSQIHQTHTASKNVSSRRGAMLQQGDILVSRGTQNNSQRHDKHADPPRSQGTPGSVVPVTGRKRKRTPTVCPVRSSLYPSDNEQVTKDCCTKDELPRNLQHTAGLFSVRAPQLHRRVLRRHKINH